MIITITAVARKRTTPALVSGPRTETLNTAEQPWLIAQGTDPDAIARAYEAYWNDVSPHSVETVHVLTVTVHPDRAS